MELRITILCENTAGATAKIIGEHGFAAFIEKGEGNYLFDTGQGLGLVKNASLLKKDLRTVRKVFLSHGHRDHTGGLLSLLKICPNLEIFAHPDIFLKRFSVREVQGKEVKSPIGVTFSMQDLLKKGARLQLNKEFLPVTEDLFLTGEVPRVMPFEKGDTRLYKREGNHLVPDPILDDQSLVVKTARGLVLLLGCAHSGLINILHLVREKFPQDPIHAILGGMHLGFLDEDQKWESIGALQDFPFDRIGPCHCTGQKASAELFQTFPDKCFFVRVGSVLEV